MDDDNSKYTTDASGGATEAAAPAPEVDEALARRSKRLVCTAGLLCLLAWVLLYYCAWGSVAAAVLSLVPAIWGLRGSRGTVHWWAVTVIIASAVLLLVFVSFWIILNKLLPS